MEHILRELNYIAVMQYVGVDFVDCSDSIGVNLDCDMPDQLYAQKVACASAGFDSSKERYQRNRGALNECSYFWQGVW